MCVCVCVCVCSLVCERGWRRVCCCFKAEICDVFNEYILLKFICMVETTLKTVRLVWFLHTMKILILMEVENTTHAKIHHFNKVKQLHTSFIFAVVWMCWKWRVSAFTQNPDVSLCLQGVLINMNVTYTFTMTHLFDDEQVFLKIKEAFLWPITTILSRCICSNRHSVLSAQSRWLELGSHFLKVSTPKRPKYFPPSTQLLDLSNKRSVSKKVPLPKSSFGQTAFFLFVEYLTCRTETGSWDHFKLKLKRVQSSSREWSGSSCFMVFYWIIVGICLYFLVESWFFLFLMHVFITEFVFWTVSCVLVFKF